MYERSAVTRETRPTTPASVTAGIPSLIPEEDPLSIWAVLLSKLEKFPVAIWATTVW